MVVDNLNARWPRTLGPGEAYAPLSVNSDRKLPSSFAPKGFQAITGQRPQRVQRGSRIQDGQPLGCLLLKPLKCGHELVSGEPLGSHVPIAEYHSFTE